MFERIINGGKGKFMKSIDEIFNNVNFEKEKLIDSSDNNCSLMIKKLKYRIETHSVDKYISWLQSGQIVDSHKLDNIILENDEFNHKMINRNNGKYFTIIDDNNIVTMMYEVYKSWSCESMKSYYYVERMDFAIDYLEDGKKAVTYYIDKPQKDGNRIILLHFDKDKSQVIINTGILMGDEINLSLHPTIFPISSSEAKIRRNEYDFTLDGISEQEIKDFIQGASGKVEYYIDVDSTINIIDTTTYKPIKKRIIVDKGEFCARIELKAGHNYFAFRIDAKEDLLSEYEIAECYYYGLGDFHKDIIKAAEIFEKIGDMNSNYMLAHIWLEDESDDEESLIEGISYLEKAARLGHDIAKVEIVYYKMKLLFMLPIEGREIVEKELVESVDNAVATNIPEAFYLAGYVYEKRIFEDNDNKSFEFYYRAAEEKIFAAQLRISYYKNDIPTKRNAYTSYYEITSNYMGVAEYCMGCFLADSDNIGVSIRDILYFYEFAANSGIKSAIRELIEVYMEGNEQIEQNQFKAIELYEKLDDLTNLDVKVAIKIVQCYLSGIGCEKGSESDIKAFSLLKNIAKSCNSGKAYYLLGLMYMGELGDIKYDYYKAKECFEKSEELGYSESIYNLGVIYEKGYGVKKNIEKALSYYEKGMQLGMENCIFRVQAIIEQNKVNYFNVNIQELFIKIQKELYELKNTQIKEISKVVWEEKKNNYHMAELYNEVKDISKGIEKIDSKVNYLVDYIKNEMSVYLKEKKRLFDQSVDSKKDVGVAKFIEDTSSYINKSIILKGDEIVIIERDRLELLFGENWNYLLPVSQTSLISASTMLKKCSDIHEDFDFSGVCICVTAALETELKRIFFDGLINYMKAKYGEPGKVNADKIYENWPEVLLSIPKHQYIKGQNDDLEVKSVFIMGNLPYLFGVSGKLSKKKNICSNQLEQSALAYKCMSEYLATIVNDKYKDNAIDAFFASESNSDGVFYKNGCFVHKCEKIRIDYRNKAAHISVMSENQALTCYQSVVTKLDTYNYNTNIVGTLMELFYKINGLKLNSIFKNSKYTGKVTKDDYLDNLDRFSVGQVVEMTNIEVSFNGGLRGIIYDSGMGVSLSKKHLLEKGLVANDYVGKVVQVKLIRWDANARKYNAEWIGLQC